MERKSPNLKIPKISEIKSQIFLSLGAIIVIYMVVSTIQAIWRNYKLDRELVTLREEHTELQIENKYLQNLIAYRKTDSFKDKQARQKLNYQKQGETVLIIPDDNSGRFVEGNAKAQPGFSQERELTNPEKWWQFLFG